MNKHADIHCSTVHSREKAIWDPITGVRNKTCVYTARWIDLKKLLRDFLGGPVTKTSSSQCRGPGLILGQGTRFCKVTIKTQYIQIRPSLVAQVVKNPPATQETLFQSLSPQDPLEEAMANHCSFLPGESHGQRSLAGL